MTSDREGIATGIVVLLVVVLLVIGLAVGGYEGGWWLTTNNANRSLNLQQHVINKQNKIVRSSYEFSTTQLQELQNDQTNVVDQQEALAADPNDAAIISTIKQWENNFCSTYNLVIDPTSVPAELQSAAAQYHCSAT